MGATWRGGERRTDGVLTPAMFAARTSEHAWEAVERFRRGASG